jgi:hypothetical protein
MPHDVFTTILSARRTNLHSCQLCTMYCSPLPQNSPKTPNARKEAPPPKRSRRRILESRRRHHDRRRFVVSGWFVFRTLRWVCQLSNTSFDIPIGCHPKKRCALLTLVGLQDPVSSVLLHNSHVILHRPQITQYFVETLGESLDGIDLPTLAQPPIAGRVFSAGR